MLETITFGTFYFFLGELRRPAFSPIPLVILTAKKNLAAFCVILIVWVRFFVPESRGVRIEEMDKVFGGNDGEAEYVSLYLSRKGLSRHLGVVNWAPSRLIVFAVSVGWAISVVN